MKILVIDDEVEVANLLADAVRLDGHEPVVAHRGDAGLAAVTRDRPDAVFLDVVMPDMSGLEVLRQIRSRDAGLPVVLITGRAREDQIEEAHRLGVSEIVEKPDVLKHLTEAVKALQGPRR